MCQDFPICVTRWSKEREEEERVKREQEAGTWAVSQHSEKDLKRLQRTECMRTL